MQFIAEILISFYHLFGMKFDYIKFLSLLVLVGERGEATS